MKKGQINVANIIGLVVGVILIVAVLMPVTDDVVQNQGFTGTTKTITDLFIVLEGVAGLVLIAAAILGR